MNPEKPSREEIEAKLTALLLGELPAEEAQLLRWAISQDAALAKLHDRLKLTVGFVREVAANPADATPAQTAPLKLSDERREKLLAHFKTIAPREFVPLVPPLKRRETSWLMPLAIAAAVVLVAIGLASVITPNFVKARATSQANANINKLRQLDAAKDQFALEEKNSPTTARPMATPPPAGSEQRIESVEAYFQNGSPTSNGADAWKKQTTIILPASGSDAGQLAVASPAPSANFNFGLAGGGFGGGGNASGNFQGRLQSMDRRATGESGGASFTGVSRDDASGLRMELSQNSVVQNQFASESRFSRNPAPGAAADKVPMLGDVPLVGGLFQNSPANQGGEIDATTATTPATTVVAGGTISGLGGIVLNGGSTLNYVVNGTLSDDLSKSGTGTLALNGVNTFSGGTTVSAGNLGVANDGNGQFAFDSTAQLNRSRGIDQNETDFKQANVAITPLPSQQVFMETSPALPASAPTVAPPAVVEAPSPIIAEDEKKLRLALNNEAKSQPSAIATREVLDEDRPIQKTPSPAPIPTPEILTRENAFSTFSLNVSDVSFKLAAASLERGQLPDAASIRSEEFLNAFNYHDPEPLAGVPVAFVVERARDPFAQNRDLLRFSIKTAAAGRKPGRPLNIVLLLDNSGSMERADRVAIIHEALKVLASQLQPQDTLSIVTFARTARLWVDGARGDQAATAVNKVSDLVPEGGTNLEEAMNLAYATARRHYLANGGNRVVLLTDGAANLGNVNPEALKQKVEVQRKQGIALDCFGIGWEGYNDDLLEVLSSNGDGRYGFINTPEAATTEFAAQLAGALHVAAEDVKVQVEFNPQRVISYRQIGYAKHQLTKEQFRDNTVAAAPLAAREAGNALYTVEINPQGAGPIATVRVRFRIPGTTDVSEHEWEVPFDGTAPALEKSSPALRLAATASAFSEWLASSPYAQEVTTDQLLNYLNGVPAIYGADARPNQLETMIREAKSLSGK